MDLRLSHVELCIIALAHGIRQIKDTRFGFKGHSEPRTPIIVAHPAVNSRILRPAAVDKIAQEGISPHQVTVLKGANGVL